MPSTRHTFSKCGHKGFGSHCHRCALADTLEKKAESAKNDTKKAELKAEVSRLRAPRAKKFGSFTPTVVEG